MGYNKYRNRSLHRSFSCAAMALVIAIALLLYAVVPQTLYAQSNYWPTDYWSGTIPGFTGWSPSTYNFDNFGRFGTYPSYPNYNTYNPNYYTYNYPIYNLNTYSFFPNYQWPQTYPGTPWEGFPNNWLSGNLGWPLFNPVPPVFGWPSLPPVFNPFPWPGPSGWPPNVNVPGTSVSQVVEPEEYTVYSAYISDQYGSGGDTIRIRSYTSYLSEPNPENLLSYFDERTLPVSAEVVYDYCNKNQQEYPLAKQFSLDPDSYELVGEEDPYGVLDLSRVGFNAARTQALFQVGLMSGPLAGYGSYVLMIKVNGVWQVKDSVMAWIS